MLGLHGNTPSSPYVPVVNSDPNEAIPPFGLMQSVSINTIGQSVISRPDGTNADVLINGAVAIPRMASQSSQDNVGQGHRTFPTIMAYQNDNAGGFAPQAGEEWGPIAGSWYLHKGQRGFRILGGGANGLVNAMPTYGNAPQPFPATLTRRQLLGGKYIYGGTIDSYSYDPSTFETQTQGSDSFGTLPAEIQTPIHTQTSDGLNPDIWTIKVIGATGGQDTFTETYTGGPHTTAAENYDATDTTINGVLTKFTVASTTVGDTRTYVFTSTDATDTRSIAITSYTGNPLTPEHPHYPAAFRNNVAMDVPVAVHLLYAAGENASVTYQVTQAADGTSVPEVGILAVLNGRDGTFTIKILPGDTPQTIKWNDTHANIQTAISALGHSSTVTGSDGGPWTITYSDFTAHGLIIDDTLTIGTTWYIVFWSNGNDCTGGIGGLYAPSITGYTGPPAPTISVTPTGSSVGPWTIIITNATSGNYQVIATGGATGTSDQAWNVAPSGFSGITVSTLATGIYLLTGNGSTSYTFVVKGAKLRSSDYDYAPFIAGGNCVNLEPIGTC